MKLCLLIQIQACMWLLVIISLMMKSFAVDYPTNAETECVIQENLRFYARRTAQAIAETEYATLTLGKILQIAHQTA